MLPLNRRADGREQAAIVEGRGQRRSRPRLPILGVSSALSKRRDDDFHKTVTSALHQAALY